MHSNTASDRALGLMYYYFALLARNVYTQQCVHLLSLQLNDCRQHTQGTVKL
jgi:hypothetical protein